MSFRSLPTLLIQTLNAVTSVRPRVLKVDTTNLTLTDNGDSTLTLGATAGGGGSNATTLDVTVANVTGSTINAGSVVSWSDVVDANGVPKVVLSSASNFNGFGVPFGIVLANIANNGTGTCRCIGTVTGLDTSGFSAGDDVWAGNSGALATTSVNGLWLGLVQVSNAVTGSVFVGSGIASLAYVGFHTHTGTPQGGYLTSPVLQEMTSPGASPAGFQYLFIDSVDHVLKRINSSGTITPIG